MVITYTYIIASWILVFYLVFWNSLKVKQDLINYSETSVRVLIAYLIVAVIFVSSQITIISLIYNLYLNHSANNNILILSISIYLLILIASILSCTKRPGIKTNNTNNEDREWLQNNVRKLASEIGLANPPTVMFSNFKDGSPETIGNNFTRKTFIVFPINFREYINKCVKKAFKLPEGTTDEKNFNVLKDFVILHELAHIKNKDVFYNSYATPFIINSIGWIVVSLIAIVMANIFSVKLTAMPIAISLISIVTLRYVTISFQRKREILADASAMVYLSYEKTRLLVGESKLLEKLFQYFDACPRSDKPSSSSLAFAGIMNSATHPPYPERIKTLEKHKSINQKKPVPDLQSIIYTGIFNTLLFLTIFQIVYDVKNIFDPYGLKYSLIWTHSSMIGVVLPAVLSCIALTIPLKHAHGLKSDFIPQIKQYSFRFGIFIAITVLLFGILSIYSKYRIDPIQSAILFRPQSILYNLVFCFVFYIIMTVFIVTKVSFGTTVNNKDIPMLIVHMFVLLCYFVITTFVLSKFIHLDKRLYIAVMCASALISCSTWLANGAISYDGQFILFVLLKRRICLEFKSRFIWISKVQYFLTLYLTILLLMAPGILFYYPILYLWNYLKLYLAQPGVESVISGDRFLSIIPLIVFVIFHKRFMVKPVDLKSNHLILKLAILLKHPFDKDYANSLIDRKIEKQKNSNKISIKNNYNGKEFDITLFLLRLSKYNGTHEVIEKERIYSEISEHCNASGGFAIKKDGTPRLETTWYALSIINELEMLSRLNYENIISWINSCQDKKKGCFKSPLYGSYRISETFCAIKSMELIGGKVHNPALCELWLYERWKQDPTIENTFYFISCLDSLKTLNKKYASSIIDKCLQPNESKYRLWRYDKNVEIIYRYLYIARYIYGEESEKYKQLTSNSNEEFKRLSVNTTSKQTK